MTALTTYGDLEVTVMDFLAARLAGVSLAAGVEFGTRIPTAPDVFVLLRRVGGEQQRYVDRPTVDVQVWHRSDTEAHDLAALVLAHLWQIEGVGQIRQLSSVTGPVPVPDPDSNQARYLATVTFTVKGVPA